MNTPMIASNSSANDKRCLPMYPLSTLETQISKAPVGAYWQLTALSAVIARGRTISYVFQVTRVVRSPIDFLFDRTLQHDIWWHLITPASSVKHFTPPFGARFGKNGDFVRYRQGATIKLCSSFIVYIVHSSRVIFRQDSGTNCIGSGNHTHYGGSSTVTGIIEISALEQDLSAIESTLRTFRS